MGDQPLIQLDSPGTVIARPTLPSRARPDTRWRLLLRGYRYSNGSSGFSPVTRLSPSCPLRNCPRQASAGSHLFVSAAGPVPPIRLRGCSSWSGYSDPEWREPAGCNFKDVLKLFFKRPSSFCIHWRFSLSPIVKRRPTATCLGCPFFIAVRRFSAGARFVCRDTARLDHRPCPAP